MLGVQYDFYLYLLRIGESPNDKSTLKRAAEDPEQDADHKKAAELADAKPEPKETPVPPAEAWFQLWFLCGRLCFGPALDLQASSSLFRMISIHVKSPGEESTEKAPDGKEAIEPANAKLEPKETPIPPAEAGSLFRAFSFQSVLHSCLFELFSRFRVALSLLSALDKRGKQQPPEIFLF